MHSRYALRHVRRGCGAIRRLREVAIALRGFLLADEAVIVSGERSRFQQVSILRRHGGAAIGVQGELAFLRSGKPTDGDLAGFSVASSLDPKQSRSRFESGHAYPVDPYRTQVQQG